MCTRTSFVEKQIIYFTAVKRESIRANLLEKQKAGSEMVYTYTVPILIAPSCICGESLFGKWQNIESCPLMTKMRHFDFDFDFDLKIGIDTVKEKWQKTFQHIEIITRRWCKTFYSRTHMRVYRIATWRHSRRRRWRQLFSEIK
jgi:hypothetical protein